MYLKFFYLTLLATLITSNKQDWLDPNEAHTESTCSESCASAINRDQSSSKVTQTLDSNPNYDTTDMTLLEGNNFEMGSEDAHFAADHETPIRNASVQSYYIDKYAVTNKKFDEFIKASGYNPDAVKYGDSFVFDRLLPEGKQDILQDMRAVSAKWWVKLPGTSWDHPEGPESGIENRLNHPVVHVSWHDAVAYCKYYGKRLPTEEEWEYGCRGGLRQKLFPWGNNLLAKNIHRTNIWQGDFPKENTLDDGWFGTCPVDEFPPNEYGLFNMVGNVWEWTSTLATEHSKVYKLSLFESKI